MMSSTCNYYCLKTEYKNVLIAFFLIIKHGVAYKNMRMSNSNGAMQHKHDKSTRSKSFNVIDTDHDEMTRNFICCIA